MNLVRASSSITGVRGGIRLEVDVTRLVKPGSVVVVNAFVWEAAFGRLLFSEEAEDGPEWIIRGKGIQAVFRSCTTNRASEAEARDQKTRPSGETREPRPGQGTEWEKARWR